MGKHKNSKASKVEKAAKSKSYANVSMKSESHSEDQPESYYDIGKASQRCPTFSETTDYAAWTLFKNFYLLPYAVTIGAKDLITTGKVGNKLIADLKAKTPSLLDIYAQVINVTNEKKIP
jgi:hypothetical protein